MSRKIKILAFTLLIVVLMVGIVYAGYVKESDTIELKDEKGKYQTYTLYDNQEICVNSEKGWGWDMLNNPNVLCAQHGGSVADGLYKVHEKIDVSSSKTSESDSILAYILNHLPDNRTYYTREPSQIAFWQYLWNYQSIEETHARDKILEELTTNEPTETDGEYDQDSNKAGMTLYREAETYANDYKNLSIQIETPKLEDNQLTIEVGGTFEGWTLKINDNEKASYSSDTKKTTITIEKDDISDDGKIKIKAEAYYTKYEAEYRVLKKDNSQRMIVVTNTSSTQETVSTPEEEVIPSVDVSLQKYITKVNDKEITSTHTSLTTRENTKTATDETNQLVKDNIKTGVTALNNYKKSNTVKIEVGDEVTYRVYIYNNSNLTAKKVNIKDTMPYYTSNNQTISYTSIESIYINGGTNDIKGSWNLDTGSGNKNTYCYTVDDLAGGNSVYFDITLKVKEYTGDILTNTAWISSTTPTNKNTYRTLDRDYIKMKDYKVSLDKFISAVNDIGLGSKKYDFNEDGVVDYIDVNYLLKYIDGWDLSNVNGINIKKNIENNGDISRNGKIQKRDADLLKKLLDTNLKNLNKSKYDFNEDGVVDYIDVNYLLKYIDGWDLSNVNGINIKNNIENNGDIDRNGEIANNDVSKLRQIIRDDKRYNTSATDKTNIDNYNPWKFNNPVTVSNKDKVTYTIRVTNDGETQVKNITIQDILPSGVEFQKVEGAKYSTEDIPTSVTVTTTRTENGRNFTVNNEILAGESLVVRISVKVTESNISLNCLQNTAKILNNTIQNKNGVDVIDTTLEDNQDSDYFQMKDIVISGTVWNDRALNKTQDNYNGIYDSKNENGLEGIKVYLYRYNNTEDLRRYDLNGDGIVDNYDLDRMKKIMLAILDIQELPKGVSADFNNDGQVGTKDSNLLKDVLYSLNRDGLITTTTTDKNGNYSFEHNYIKGPKLKGTNRWAGIYYSYYVVFEYDGITYTSTFDTNGKRIWAINENGEKQYSNAQEDGAKVEIFREDFNAKFSTINNKSGITYTTTNETDYIPQSIHKYNPATMAMQSSTNIINLSNDDNLVSQLQHVNLGLRGRDIFDLELTSDVAKVDVTVHGQKGTYNFTNKVTIRRTDLYNENGDNYYWTDKNGLEHSVARQDAANIYQDKSEYVGEEYDQGIRKTDIDVEETGAGQNGTTPYKSTGLEIKVTYKITVTNASQTRGTATKVIDYYDKDYSDPKAFLYYRNGDGNEVKKGEISINPETDIKSITNKNSVELCKSVELNVGEDIQLDQSDSYYIYLTLTMNVDSLKNVFNNLKKLNNNIVKLDYPAFNMSEIAEYKTYATSKENEYTRGLLDKDSEPGSASIEKVRTTETGNEDPKEYDNDESLSTVEYYFSEDRLKNLKYEDDTYATPTLYFVTPNDNEKTLEDESYPRTITGTVFEDLTTTDNVKKIKTGNGKLDKGEVGVYGATVELVEIDPTTTSTNPNEIGENVGTVRYREDTDENGQFTIKGFLPGYYVIRYRYGDTINTVLLNQSDDKTVNKKSYNGEDYQSTNNAFEVQDEKGNIISNKLDTTKGNLWYVTNEKEGISTGTDNEYRRYIVHKNVMDYVLDYKNILNDIRNGKILKENDYIDTIIDNTNMYATTPQMLFTVEKTINLNELGEDKENLIESKQITVKNDNSELGEWAVFPNKNSEYYKKYEISNMNFGIAELPKTTINLKKHVKSFTLYDSTGDNLIAGLTIDENGEWTKTGDVIYLTEGVSRDTVDVSVEDEKLQGARLRITYEISTEMESEINYNGILVPTKITEVVDYIDNNLSYNPTLGENGENWQITTYSELNKDGKGLQQSDENEYTTIVKAKEDNPILLKGDGTGKVTITLEKILSSSDTTIEDIITSTVDIYKYSNTVEITKISQPHDDDPTTDQNPNTPDSDTNPNPPDTPEPLPPTKNTVDKFPVPPAQSEDVTIHPPTGDSEINIIYLIIGIISLGILAAGAFCIKKFVLKNNK